MKLIIITLVIAIFAFAAFGQEDQSKVLAENFTAVSTNGESFELESLRGKVVVLTFWSTKCEICRIEIPKLNKIVKDHEGQAVVFLAVTMNSESVVNAFTKKNPFNFHILPNGFGVVLKYAKKDGEGNIEMGFPSHYVINQNGRIELATTGFNKLEKVKSEINRLLSVKKLAAD